MAEVANELMYEVLKQIQNDLSAVKSTTQEIKAELTAVRMHQFAIQQDIHNIYGMLGRHDERLDRIERRLELTEPVH